MEIKIQCPHCSARYLVESDVVGEAIRCVRCDQEFTGKPYAAPAPPPQRAKLRMKAAVTLHRVGTGLEEKRIPHLGLELAAVLPGSFRQGGAPWGYQNENPGRTVHLTYPFWISRCPITQFQFREVMNRNPSYFEGDDLPVENVTWQEGLEFCRRLTEIERVAKRISPSLYFRLPTEAEWEYCCLAGLGSEEPGDDTPEAKAFLHGDAAALPAYAWFAATSEGGTHPVGTLKPNRWGLYDTLGNVAEWCMDWYGVYPPGDVTDPKGPETGRRKVRRGGGWTSSARRCRAGERIGVAPVCASALIGFRIVAVRVGEPPFSFNYHLW